MSYNFEDEKSIRRVIRATKAVEQAVGDLTDIKGGSSSLLLDNIFARLTSRDNTDKWKAAWKQVSRKADGTWEDVTGGLTGSVTDYPACERSKLTHFKCDSSTGSVVSLKRTMEKQGDGSYKLVWIFDVPQIGQFFPVKVTNSGGSAGDESTACSFTYDVTDVYGNSLAEDATPEQQRAALGTYIFSGSDYGVGFYDETGAFKLAQVYGERLDVETCD